MWFICIQEDINSEKKDKKIINSNKRLCFESLERQKNYGLFKSQVVTETVKKVGFLKNEVLANVCREGNQYFFRCLLLFLSTRRKMEPLR
jgi:hypothetical protein